MLPFDSFSSFSFFFFVMPPSPPLFFFFFFNDPAPPEFYPLPLHAALPILTKRAMAPLVADNPHLAEVVALEPDEPLRHLARRLAALAPPPTHGLDLHGSVRSVALRLLVRDRKSTRLNSSHLVISYAVFCLK